MHDQETYELIERYLRGECSPEEAALVQHRQQNEPEFAALLDLHRELEATLADADTLRFAKELAAAGAAYHSGTHLESPTSQSELERGTRPLGRRAFTWQRWAVAASIALMAVVGGYFLLADKSMSPAEAYQEYFTIYDAPANFRSDSETITERYQTAFAAYNARDWEGAIQAFTAVTATDSNQVTAQFYGAMAMIADGQTAAAIAALQKITAKPGPFATQSKWYLALAWLKQGDADAAKAILKPLADGTAGKYKLQAQELLDALGD